MVKSLSDLGALYAGVPFQPGYPVEEYVKLYAPADHIGDALRYMLKSAESSVVMAVAPYLPDEIQQDVVRLLNDDKVFVQLTSSFRVTFPGGPGNSVVFGNPYFSVAVIDGLDVVNWTGNELSVIRAPMVAVRTRVMLDRIHEAARATNNEEPEAPGNKPS